MKRFKNILLYAGCEQNEGALNRAVQLAIENRACLTLMDVVKPIPRALGMLTDVADSEELQQLVARDHRTKLFRFASDYIDTAVPIDVVVVIGDPATEIVRQVVSGKHDLVIKTADGLSSVGRLFGSVARSLLRLCPCPVWVLKPEIHGKFDRVLAAVDLEASDEAHRGLNRKILEITFSLAELEGAKAHIVSAWDLWMEKCLRRRSGDAEVDAALAAHEEQVHHALNDLMQIHQARGEKFEVHLYRGNPAAIVRWVADRIEADLLVMGTVCRTGAAGFLIGNTAETVLSDVTCSVLAMKPAGFVTPVEPAVVQVDNHSEHASVY